MAKWIKFTKKKIITIAVSAVIVIAILAGFIVGDVLCAQYKNIITQYLCGFGLDEDSEETQAARAAGNALAAKVEEEGAVLLKNNGALPLKNKKVNVFGYAGCDNGFIPQGSGSGTGSRNDYVSFLGGLKEAGIEYNEQLAADYARIGWKRVDSGNFVFEATDEGLYRDYYGVLEADEAFYSNSARMAQAKSYSDTAIVVIGRLLGEGNDYSKKQYVREGTDDDTRVLQSISQREEHMLREVAKNFENVIVVLNTTNPMEMGFIEEAQYGVDAALFMGMPGTRGSIGLARILTGEANPSGHTTDTWAYDISTAASYATSGREGVGSYTDIQNGDTSLNSRQNKYSDYVEDIYVGYKWYETADAEGFWNSSAARLQWNINGYDSVVQFPFGFGLSYTKFEWTLVECNYEDGATLDKDGTIKIKMTVKNTGTVAGKDVVQLYYTPPYTKGGIEKSAVNLGAFAKTGLLDPGKVETLEIELPVEDMKSYDCYDRNNNGFMGYELEEGEYTISFRTDAHTLAKTGNGDGKNSYTFKVPAGGYKYEVDSVTQTKVENQFTTYTNPVSGASSTINEPAVSDAHSIDGNDEDVKISYMTRNDFVNTFPFAKAANRTAGKLKNDTLYVKAPVVDATEQLYTDKITPSAVKLTLDDVWDLPYGHEKWDQLVLQLSIGTQTELIFRGGFGTIEISSIGKPKTVDQDGPCGFNNSVTGNNGQKAVCYPSATVIGGTWDWFIAYQVGQAIGTEGNALGNSGWYGPGANLHRSVMGGRNFEYYSEDARLSGIMCAYEVLGAKEHGVVAYVKHMAVNDSDSGRNGAYKWLTEQNLRENYLLPFEYIVKVGKGNGMMSSVDRVGSTRASASYAMLTTVLRDEWGFRGTVITDYYQNFRNGASIHNEDMVHDVDECVRAGNSQILYTEGGMGQFNDVTSNTAKNAIFKSAKDILFSYVDAKHYAETAQGLDKGSLIGNSIEVYAWWIPVLISVEVIVFLLLVAWMLIVFDVHKLIFKKKVKAEDDFSPDSNALGEASDIGSNDKHNE